jgi:hypothetical protein
LGAAVVAAISTQAQVLGLNTFGEMQPLWTLAGHSHLLVVWFKIKSCGHIGLDSQRQDVELKKRLLALQIDVVNKQFDWMLSVFDT